MTDFGSLVLWSLAIGPGPISEIQVRSGVCFEEWGVLSGLKTVKGAGRTDMQQNLLFGFLLARLAPGQHIVLASYCAD